MLDFDQRLYEARKEALALAYNLGGTTCPGVVLGRAEKFLGFLLGSSVPTAKISSAEAFVDLGDVDRELTFESFAKTIRLNANAEIDRQSLILSQHQIDMIEAIEQQKQTTIIAARQLGTTFGLAFYALWKAISQEGTKVLVLSNSRSASTDVLNHVFDMAAQTKLCPPFTCRSSEMVEFDNESSIRTRTFAGNPVRCNQQDIILVDNAGLIPFGIGSNLLNSLLPTLAMTVDARIVFAGTPTPSLDERSLLFKLRAQALSITSSSNRGLLVNTWKADPSRTQAWADEMISFSGREIFRCEQECLFKGLD